MDQWKQIGQALLEGKQISELTLKGKHYIFNKTQTEFISDFKSDYCLNAGGYGSGKTLALDVKLLLSVKCFPGNVVLLGRKTLSDLTRATLPDFFNLIPPNWYEYRVKDGLINFTNGSQIILFGLDAMQSGGIADIKKAQQKLKSLNLGNYFIDQLEEVEYDVIEVLNSRLRRKFEPEVEELAKENGMALRQGNSTCNPANFWAYHVFKLKKRLIDGEWVSDPDNRSALYQSSMVENSANLPEDYLRKQLASDPDYVKRFVHGIWDTSVLVKGTVFAKEYIKRSETWVKNPIEVREGCKIYEKPNSSLFYQMGVDPSEGIVDPSAIVLASSEGRVVATFNGMVTIPELADKIKFLYYHYGKPKVIPEVNKSSLLEHIKDLNLYRRRTFDEKTRRDTEKLGFMTSWSSKQALITHFQDLLRNNYPKLSDRKIIEEMNSFVWSDEASRQGAGAARSFHDDMLIATMLAFWELKPIRVEQIMINQAQPSRKRVFGYK
jgi:hypothetical protein